MNETLISIIMPVYNRSSIISDSIQSILNQTYPHWELIIADDGSRDHSAQFIREHFKDDRIKVIELPHQGVAMTRNTALNYVHGDFICFLDSDDQWPDHKLDRQLKVMNETKAEISIGYFIDRSGSDDPYPILRKCPPQITLEGLLIDNCVLFQTLMAKQMVLKDLIFENAPHEDYRLALSLIQKGHHFEVIPEVLAYRLRHKKSLSSNKLKSALWRFNIYRDQLKFSWVKSMVYTSRYAWCSLTKHRSLK